MYLIRTSQNAWQSILHLFFPHTCCGCGSDILDQQQLLCLSCEQQLPLTGFEHTVDNAVENIFRGRLPVTAAAAHVYFSKGGIMQQLIHQLKYHNRPDIGIQLGKRLGAALKNSHRFDHIEALVPLPLFAARLHKRGYNQAAVLCEGIAHHYGVPVYTKAIDRIGATETQTHKNRIDRWLNMQDRFRVRRPELVRNKHILLVDDVVTTGATLEACGEVLLAAGCELSIATLAVTTGR